MYIILRTFLYIDNKERNHKMPPITKKDENTALVRPSIDQLIERVRHFEQYCDSQFETDKLSSLKFWQHSDIVDGLEYLGEVSVDLLRIAFSEGGLFTFFH